MPALPQAKATFVDKSRQSIAITIDGVPQTLSVNDCISFNRDVKEGADPYTIAKILGFGYAGDKYVNRIFYVPWRVAEKRWGSQTLQSRAVGLESPYKGSNEGDWTTLVKLAKCPDQNGGKRKTNRAKKSKRNTRRH
jgi:hypothetical protein